MTIFLLDKAGNTVGKGENAGYQHFLLFPQCFPKLSSLGSLKVWLTFYDNVNLYKTNKPRSIELLVTLLLMLFGNLPGNNDGSWFDNSEL